MKPVKKSIKMRYMGKDSQRNDPLDEKSGPLKATEKITADYIGELKTGGFSVKRAVFEQIFITLFRFGRFNGESWDLAILFPHGIKKARRGR